MRIGVIRMRYTPYGGAEVFLERFISELLKRGHTVDVFSTDWRERDGVRVHRIKAPGPKFIKPLLFAMNVKKEVLRVRPDVVVSLERTFSQDIYRAGDGCHREWLERRAGSASPLKRLSIALNPAHRVTLMLEKKLFSSPGLKKVVANSRMVRADIIRHYGLPEKDICVIYNGINPLDFEGGEDPVGKRKRLIRPLGVPEDSTVILFVGSGFERKGLISLIRALPRLKEKDGGIWLVVVGKGNPSGYLKEAGSLGVSDRVIFAGAVKDVIKYYLASDVFVLPSLYEPFSNACLEAMASGLPVVTSRANGASEIITEGKNGSVIEDPADPEEVALKVYPFLSKEKRREAGSLARAAAMEYTIERNVSEFLKLLDETGASKHG